MNKGPSLLRSTQLKERGWTPILVKQFLDPADATGRTPHYTSASPLRLYALARVEATERGADWKLACAALAQCSQVGKMMAARKAAELVKEAERLPITVTRLPSDQRLTHAIASYNAFREEMLWERGHDYESASEQSNPADLSRIMVNYIRHNLTKYDTHLEELAGQVGVSEAGRVIARRVYALDARYPEYAQDCTQQMSARHGEAS